MNMKNKQELEKIFYLFFRNRIKAYLVATGTNNKYMEIKDKDLKDEAKKVVEHYTIENIFMGQGINMLVASLEVLLRDLFEFQARNNRFIEDKIRKNVRQSNGTIEDLIKKNWYKFKFQNLKNVSENFKEYLNIDLVKIFNETGKQFEHTNKEEQDRIANIGFFNYFKCDIWPLRHKIIYESKVPEYGKDIWGMLFNVLNVIAKKIKNEVEIKVS